MPTMKECMELKNECTWTWTSQNGARGCRVTGPNGNNIFLPAAGWRDGTGINYYGTDTVNDYTDFFGVYWSSTLGDVYSPRLGNSASFIYKNDFYGGYNSRCQGLPVRPVSE